MSELGGLQKHKKTQHALVGLSSVALAAAVALPREVGPNFLRRIKSKKKKITTKNLDIYLQFLLPGQSRDIRLDFIHLSLSTLYTNGKVHASSNNDTERKKLSD